MNILLSKKCKHKHLNSYFRIDAPLYQGYSRINYAYIMLEWNIEITKDMTIDDLIKALYVNGYKMHRRLAENLETKGRKLEDFLNPITYERAMEIKRDTSIPKEY